jgi:hypothetical protein
MDKIKFSTMPQADVDALVDKVSGKYGKTTAEITAILNSVNNAHGINGTFTSSDGKTITVTKGIITSIV